MPTTRNIPGRFSAQEFLQSQLRRQIGVAGGGNRFSGAGIGSTGPAGSVLPRLNQEITGRDSRSAFKDVGSGGFLTFDGGGGGGLPSQFDPVPLPVNDPNPQVVPPVDVLPPTLPEPVVPPPPDINTFDVGLFGDNFNAGEGAPGAFGDSFNRPEPLPITVPGEGEGFRIPGGPGSPSSTTQGANTTVGRSKPKLFGNVPPRKTTGNNIVVGGR